MKLSPVSPIKFLNIASLTDKTVSDIFRSLIRLLEQTQELIAKVVNNNDITVVSANTIPIVVDGTTTLWIDTTGTPGTPKAHIIIQVGSATYTFSSKENY